MDDDNTETNSEQRIIDRTLHVHITGSLHDFASKGVNTASWRPHPGTEADVFGINDFFDSAPDLGQATSVLQNALLHEVEVKQVKNDFPINIGVTINCIPGEESIRTGQRFAFTCLAESTNTIPEVVFSSASCNQEGIEWRNRYPTYNATNLDSHGVLDVAGQNYVFVDQSHPVVDLLRTNAEKLNASIDNQPLIDNRYYKVTKQVMSQCCQVLRSKVLSKISTRDMNNFCLQLHRIEATEWTDSSLFRELHTRLTPNEHSFDRDARLRQFTNMTHKPYSWSARIRIRYEINTAV